MLIRGLHPAITVVAAKPEARALVTSAAARTKNCTVLRSTDLDEELKRAAIWVANQHQAAVESQREKVAQAEHDIQEAIAANTRAAREAAVATTDASRFHDLATRLSAADEAFEAAVHAEAEAARSLTAALGELERILGQRHTATASLEQARNGRGKRGVPEAVVQQALALQAALAKAEAERRDAVQQADEDLQAARATAQQASEALSQTHQALLAGMETLSGGPPPWGDGVPLPGLLDDFRDRLAQAQATAEEAAAEAKGVEHATRARLEQAQRDLDAMVSAGPPVLDHLDTAGRWVGSDLFTSDEVVFADDAFSRFGPDGATTLVKALAGRGCQVVYLTEDPDLLSWAISLPHDEGAVSTVSSTRDQKPVLVGDGPR